MRDPSDTVSGGRRIAQQAPSTTQSLLAQEIRKGGLVVVKKGTDVARGNSMTNRQVLDVELGPGEVRDDIGLYAIELLAELNDSLRHLIQDNYFVQREEEMNKIHQVLFYHKNTGQFLATLIVSAALPAIVEEVIFRGILFGKLMVTSKNNLHFSAIISGLLFAAIHQQPLQILPIAFMGAGFAYLYHYTQNLKYTILLHFFVNAVQISSVFFLGGYQLF